MNWKDIRNGYFLNVGKHNLAGLRPAQVPAQKKQLPKVKRAGWRCGAIDRTSALVFWVFRWLFVFGNPKHANLAVFPSLEPTKKLLALLAEHSSNGLRFSQMLFCQLENF